eukprot:gene30305-39047_t
MSIFLQYTMSKCSSGSMNRNTTSNLPFSSVGRVTIHVTKEDGVANVRNALSSELESPQSSTLLISLIDEGMTAQWPRDSDALSLLLAMQGHSDGDSFEDILSYENGYSGSVLTDVEGNIHGDGQDRPVENWGGGAGGPGETAGGVDGRRGVDGRVGAVGRRSRTSTIGLYAAPDPPEGRAQGMSAPSSITSEAVAGSGGLSEVGVAELAVCLDWVAMMGGGVTYMPRADGVVGHVLTCALPCEPVHRGVRDLEGNHLSASALSRADSSPLPPRSRSFLPTIIDATGEKVEEDEVANRVRAMMAGGVSASTSGYFYMSPSEMELSPAVDVRAPMPVLREYRGGDKGYGEEVGADPGDYQEGSVVENGVQAGDGVGV